MANEYKESRRGTHRPRSRRRQSNPGRSGLVTAGILIVLLACFGLYWMAHRRGQFHKLRTHEIPPTVSMPMPGGQEPVVLSRLSLLNNSVPEFVSATLLPGVGMQFLQVVASAPDKEAYSLLQAPTLAQAAEVQPSTLQVAPLHLLVSKSPFSLGNPAATDVIGPASASVETETLPDGGQATARFAAASGPNGGVSATVATVLSGHTIDLTVIARNESTSERFVTFEWVPRLAYSSGGKTGSALSLPSTQTWRGTARGDASDDVVFSGVNGRSLGDKPIDATYVQLRPEFLADGPMVRLFDRQNGTVLRVTTFGPGIRSLHVRTEPVSHTLTIGFNSFDPAEPRHDQNEAVRPGQALQWHLRLEVLPLVPAGDADTGSTAPHSD